MTLSKYSNSISKMSRGVVVMLLMSVLVVPLASTPLGNSNSKSANYFDGLTIFANAQCPPDEDQGSNLCPSAEYTHFRGRCYRYLDFTSGGSVDWDSAKAQCRELQPGRHRLASVHCEEEANFIRDQVVPGGVSEGDVWFGMYTVQFQFPWEFRNGDGTSYNHDSSLWFAGEPNNGGDPGNGCTEHTASCNPDDESGCGGDPGESCGRCAAMDLASTTIPYFKDKDCGAGSKGAICVVNADCEGGTTRATFYRAGDENARPGSCTDCTAGRYRTVNDPDSSCIDCPAGRMGYAGADSAQCDEDCPEGYYCEQGTPSGSETPCQAGTYAGTFPATSSDDCLPVPAGKYSDGSNPVYISDITDPTQLDILPNCDAGRCGNEGEISSSCRRSCESGYFCEEGSTCPGAECGGEEYYCPPGASERSNVESGYYSSGGSPNTRTSQSPCPEGYYCVDGIQYACQNGTFNDLVQQSSEGEACRNCQAGSFCPEASVSATMENCAPSDVTESHKARYYCPEGTSTRQVLPEGNTDQRTGPLTAPIENREFAEACPDDQVCLNGISSDRLLWEDGVCPGGTAKASAPELTDPEDVGAILQLNATLAQVIFDRGVEAEYTVTYSMGEMVYINPDPEHECAGTNQGILSIPDETVGKLTMTQEADFEVCPPETDIRYLVVVTATAEGEGTVSEITCEVEVEILDLNDVPFFDNPIEYRQIAERQVQDTPASRCNDEGQQEFGCPVNEANSDDLLDALQANDPDIDSSLNYTFVPGELNRSIDRDDWVFKIDGCTGTVAYSGNFEVRFFPPQTLYKFVVMAEDDGNGGRFPKLSATTELHIYIINRNTPPELQSAKDPADGPDFFIEENRDPGFKVTPELISVTDEDGDDVALAIDQNDNGAFAIIEGGFATTSSGSDGIDFESSKKVYTVSVLADDGNDGFDTETYRIAVVNTNDPPKFDNDFLVFFVAERSDAGTFVCGSQSDAESETGCDGDETDRVKTTDPDHQLESLKDTDSTTYSFANLEENQGAEYFEIDPTTGQLTVKEGATIDFKSEDESIVRNSGTGRGFKFDIMATSSGDGISESAPEPRSTVETVTVYITQVNEPPVMPEGTNVTVAESASIDQEFVLHELEALDPDNSITRLLGEDVDPQLITYSTIPDSDEVSETRDGSSKFSVGTKEGSPNLPFLRINNDLDYETAPECDEGLRCYEVAVRARDNGNPPQESVQVLTIYIHDMNDPPFFPSRPQDNYEISVFENVSGLLQYPIHPEDGVAFAALDPDEDEQLTYSISSTEFLLGYPGEGEGEGEEGQQGSNDTFYIVKAADFFLRFEVKPLWKPTVTVTDQGPSSYIGRSCSFNSAGQVVTGCGPSQGAFCCTESSTRCSTPNKCVETCSATASFNKSVIENRPRLPPLFLFCDYGEEEPTSPYKESAQQEIRVQVMDSNDDPYIVDDSGSTNFPSTNSSLRPEPCIIHRSVTTGEVVDDNQVMASREVVDADDDVVDGIYGGSPFTFSEVRETPEDNEFWDKFDVDETSGRVTVNETASLVGNESFSGTIRVQDSNEVGLPGTSTCLLKVDVTFENAPPRFQDFAMKFLEENSPENLLVAKLADSQSDIDPDIDNEEFDETLTFSMTSTDAWEFNEQTLEVLTGIASFDYESVYPDVVQDIVIRVRDSLDVEDLADISVTITDVNEEPEWSSTRVITVPEDLQVDGLTESMLNHIVSDPDIFAADESWKTLTFTLVDSSNCVDDSLGASCPFELADQGSGRFKVVSAGADLLDFETGPQTFQLEVQAEDGGDPSLSAVATVTIQISDVNEAPFFKESDPVAEIYENDNGAQGDVLFLMEDLVDDPDFSDTAATLQYTIISEEGEEQEDLPFVIEDGELRIADGVIDYEERQEYVFQLQVNDTGGLSTSSSVTVRVLNVNDVVIDSVKYEGLSSGVLDCEGGENVTIEGKNFGLKDESTARNLRLFATNSISSPDSTTTFESLECDIVPGEGNQMALCETPRGVGRNLRWKLEVSVDGTGIAGDISPSRSTALRYQNPEIVQISSNVEQLGTIGGEDVVLTGTCLGDPSDNLDLSHQETDSRASYIKYCTTNPSSPDACYVPKCEHLERNVLSCESLPGIGTGFVWSGRIARQALPSSVSLGSYAPPELTGSSVTVFPTESANVPFTLQGNNFGPVGSSPEKAIFFYDYGTGSITYDLLGCEVVSDSEISCDGASPGVGSEMSVLITFGSLENALEEVIVRYESSRVTEISGDGVSGALTLGGELVSLIGDSFGPSCGEPASGNVDGDGSDEGTSCPLLDISYSRDHDRAEDDSTSIVYSPNCAVISQTEIICQIRPGTGANHRWSGTIGGQPIDFAPDVTTTSYARPIIGSYLGPGAVDADTTGFEVVSILGANFGPLEGAPIIAIYGEEENPEEFTAFNCEVVVAHQQINCETSPGAGEELAWRVFIDDQESRDEVTSYGIPVIDSVSPSELKTDGGENVTLLGKNFGPGTEFLNSVHFGPEGSNSYSVEDCVVKSHLEIGCISPPAVRSVEDMKWVVKVGDQSSEPSAESFNYERVSISEVSPATGPSSGGSTVEITGTGFGLCDSSSSLTVLFDGKSVGIDGFSDADGNQDPPCPIATEERKIRFSTPERTGDGQVEVRVRVSNSRLSETIESVQTLSFDYDVPKIDAVVGEPAESVNEVSVTILGENFCTSESCCTTYLDLVPVEASNLLLHTHDRINVLSGGAGNVQVVCTNPEVSTELFNFTTSSPFILGTDPAISETRFATTGEDEIDIWGIHFGTQASTTVEIGGRTADIVTGPNTVNCADRPAASSSVQLGANAVCFMVTVKVPESNGGEAHSIVVWNAGSQSNDNNRLDYAIPQIDAVSLSPSAGPFPTVGDTNVVVTITGTNFGLGEGGEVHLGRDGTLLCNAIGSWTHDEIQCNEVPAGEGVDLSWSVRAGGIFSNLAGSTSYLPPSNLASNVDDIDGLTEGGETLVITGSNLGRPFTSEDPQEIQNRINITMTRGGAVPIVKALVVLSSSDHNQVTCLMPEGEGRGFQMSINVGGQVVTLLEDFSYGKPEIEQLVPAEAPTDGMDPDNPDQRLELEVIGRNFGKERVRLTLGTDVLAEISPEFDDIAFTSRSHTSLIVKMPSGTGRDIPVVVEVASQESDPFEFSYLPPKVGSASFDDTVFGDSSSSDTPPRRSGSAAGFPNRNRRLLQEAGGNDTSVYGTWGSNGFGLCQADARVPGTFWRAEIEIAPSGAYARTIDHYRDQACSSEERTHRVVIQGQIFDDGENDAIRCAQDFADEVESITVEAFTDFLSENCQADDGGDEDDDNDDDDDDVCNFPINSPTNAAPCLASIGAQSRCSILSELYHAGTAFGMYLIVDDSKLFMSRLFSSKEALENAEGIGFSDDPTAESEFVPDFTAGGPVFPTDGCYEWETLSSFNQRRREESGAKRKCLQKAILTLEGGNFGENVDLQAGILRVFFRDPDTGEEFEGSTNSSEGNHGRLCEECRHTHTLIDFWIPFGSGKQLEVVVRVDGVEGVANFTVSYESPKIERMQPGTIFNKYAFQDADGEVVVVEGSNFGFEPDVASILINGRLCANPKWFTSGNGEPFIECEAPRDTVGPKSVFACVAYQTSFARRVVSDVVVLNAGEVQGSWEPGFEAQTETDGLAQRVFSKSIARCGAGRYGRFFELCADCPEGAECEIGNFSIPPSREGFFRDEITVRENVTDAVGQEQAVTDRAQERCPQEVVDFELLANFPDAISRDTCFDWVRCEPAEACTGNNQCLDGYEYAFPRCQDIRERDDDEEVSVSGEVIENSCEVVKNPLTGLWEGVHSDCRGDVPLGTACDWQRPWECSRCELIYPELGDELNVTDSENKPAGVCRCELPRRCELCTIKTHFRLFNECTECPDHPALIIALFILGVLAAIGVTYYLSKKRVNLAFITIVLDYFQVLAIFASSKIAWPPVLLRFFAVLSVFNLNIDITAPECLVPDLAFTTKWWLTMLMPLAALGVLIAMHFFYSSYKAFKLKSKAKFSSHVSKLVSIFVLLMYVLYLSVTRRALDVFNCNPTVPSDGNLYTEFTSLECEGGGLCRCGGEVQQSLVTPAIMFLILYTAGFPLVLSILLYRNRRLILEDQYLRAYDLGEERVSNPNAYDLRKRYSMVYYKFRPRASWWILQIINRKFWIAFSALIFRGNPTFQLAVILLVLFGSFVSQVRFRPFLSTGEKVDVRHELENLASRALDEPELQVYREIHKTVSIAQRAKAENERRKQLQDAKGSNRKVVGNAFWKNTDELAKKKKKKALSNKAGQYFFDFNGVESVLLASAIFVCLSGIMLDSSRFSERDDLAGQRDAITWAVIIVVMSSIIFIAAVVIHEISPSRLTLLTRLCMRRSKDLTPEEDLDAGVVMEENALMNANKLSAGNAEQLEGELETNMAALQKARQQNEQLKGALGR